MDIEEHIHLIEKSSADFTQLENQVFYSHISSDISTLETCNIPQPFRMEGAVVLLLTKGKLHINYNFEDFDAEGPAMILFSPRTVINISVDDLQNIDLYFIRYSPEFLQEINISFNIISTKALAGTRNPVMELRERDFALMMRYFSLIRTAIGEQFNIQLAKHIVASLSTAVFYQAILMVYKSIDVTSINSNLGPGRRSYVQDFLKLVHVHYTSERSVSFYASKLFISPKYLSLLVKEATGRSAARWIDSFVINEAKNLLRYSGKNIQQVAYALNFSNQSSFGKYFKHLTGMSPTEFQKS